MLCECGYHLGEKRMLAGEELTKASAADETRLRGSGPPAPPPRAWLGLSVRVLRVLAIISLVATALRIAFLSYDLLRLSDSGAEAASRPFWLFCAIVLVAAAGAVGFILLRGAAEAGEALLNVERHVVALRRGP